MPLFIRLYWIDLTNNNSEIINQENTLKWVC